MKIVKFLGIAFILFVIGALILLPRAIDVKEEKVIDANLEVTYTLVWNMQNWIGWYPNYLKDSTVLHSYTQGNVETRIGHIDEFSTTLPNMSSGKHVIVDAAIDKYIIIDVYFDKVSKDEPIYRYRFDFEPASEVGGDGKTKVTWSMTDTAKFLAIQERLLASALNEDLSKMFKEGLENLYNYAEEQELFFQFQRYDVQPNMMNNALIYEVETTTDRDSIEHHYAIAGRKVFELLQQEGIRIMEPPLLIYPKWDTVNNKATVQYGFSITSNQKANLEGKLPEYLKIVDVGSPGLATVDVLPHDKPIEHYYDVLEKYLDLKNVDIVGPRMERYMSNPEIPNMPRHVVIMFPIMSRNQ